MKNNNKLNAAFITLVIIVAFLLTTYFYLPSEFITLPAYISRFENLTNSEVIDSIRYGYKSASFGIVYGVYNNLTKRIYIGSTKDPVTRVYEHLVSHGNSNIHLQRAIIKYGLECFSFIVFELFYYSIENGVSNVKAIFVSEQRYIDMFNRNQLYNISLRAGGGGGPKSEEEKRLMSTVMMGVNAGRAPINKGIPLSVAARKAMIAGSAHRSFQIFIYDDMFNLVAIYPSISAACRTEMTQKNKFIKHVKDNTLWRGFIVTRIKL